MRALFLTLLLIGCGQTEPRGGDAALDGGAANGMDARVDARPDAGDGSVAVLTDGGYLGVPCSVGGAAGTCQLLGSCAGVSTPGYCPGPADVQCCTAAYDAGAVCDPSAMPTPNDGLVEAPGDPGCPDGMVLVDTFCIDRYEASLQLVGGGSWSPYHNPGSASVRAVSIADAVPQAYIDGVRAGAACVQAGKRLCTDTEWLRACQGPSGTTYPYGNTREPGVCNDARAVHPAVQYFGTDASWIWSHLDNACIDQLPDSLATTGSHSGCVTAEGAFDMMGNLHEWTADPAGTFRGGYYVDTVLNGNGCLYVTTAHNMSHWDYSTGFRCCADPL